MTPHLVKPMPPGAARLPTDKWIDPSEVDFYLLGLDQGRQKPGSQPRLHLHRRRRCRRSLGTSPWTRRPAPEREPCTQRTRKLPKP